MVALIGATSLLGWVTGVDQLKSMFTGAVTMKTNPAICMLLLGGALVLLRPHQKRARWRGPLGRVAAVIALVIAALTLAQHLFGYDFRIDQLLFTEAPGAAATSSPNRMGLPASVSLILASVALLMLDVTTSGGRVPAQWLGLLMGLIALLPLIGYAYRITPLYSISHYTGIALHTAVAIAVLGYGIVVARPTAGMMQVVCSDDAGGLMARRMLLPVILIPFFLGWLRTIGQRQGWFDDSIGRPLLLISLIVTFFTLVWWNAQAMSMLARQRALAEAERERLLQSERAARAEAERASEAKSEFLATLSHELRTPLTPVLLTVSLMESSPNLPAELREDVATIRRNVELESRLISDLLDLTRIVKGKLQLDMHEVDLHLLIRAAIDICQREASAKLLVELKATQHTVLGDSTRLQQIFWNLINNAQKFTPADGTIIVRSSDCGEQVCVEVIDTGAGIAPDVLLRLFSAFEQGDVRTVRQQAGLGLGLAISRRLVEEHGGTIAASSDGIGRGARFTVMLPALRATPSAPLAMQPRFVHRDGMPLSVLLVEDHQPTLAVMSRLLRALGHDVTGVSTVASARAAASQDGFDLIISDLGLPDGSGLDVMRELRGKFGRRAIALTGYGMESDIAASRDAGFAEHLTKPVDAQQLEAAIRRLRSE